MKYLAYQKLFLAVILSLTLLGFSQPASAQFFKNKDRSPILVNVKIKGKVITTAKEKRMHLKWGTTDVQYMIIAQLDVNNQVYFVRRETIRGKKRIIEGFGTSPKILEQIQSEGFEVEVKKNADLSKPFVVRKKKNKFVIKPYSDTSDLVNFLDSLEEINENGTSKSTVSGIKRTPLELGRAISFESLVNAKWKN